MLSIPRHVHRQAYVAVVLSGGYEECGSRGRFRVGPGYVLLHDEFDSHLDRFGPGGAEILNLLLTGEVPGFGCGRIGDPDTVARVAERDRAEAGARLRQQLLEAAHPPADWPDALAVELLQDPSCRLESWARGHGLAPETVSRRFHAVFGVTPARFRAEARARRAFALITGSDAPLARIAAEAGFADQAHLSRATHALTGYPPRAWRKSN